MSKTKKTKCDPEILRQIESHPHLLPEQKELIIGVMNGELIIPFTSDKMAKHLFSPDIHPERFDFIMQRIMKDPTIRTLHSAANELPLESYNSKSSIVDIPSWLEDDRLANLEIQQIAQDFAFTRFDMYSSRMLLLQYSKEGTRSEGSINYNNIPEVILVALLCESPAFLKNSNSSRYIHRFTEIKSDTGITVSLLKKVVFVQLDKALEQFLNNSYNEDEDLELLTELAMLADPNNSNVKEAAMTNKEYMEIYKDAYSFSLERASQLQLMADEFSKADYKYNMRLSEERGEKRGIKQGEERINALYSWLFDNNRSEDVRKASSDPDYCKKLFEEYNAE